MEDWPELERLAEAAPQEMAVINGQWLAPFAELLVLPLEAAALRR